jgi:anaerobic ribonucleoside-triphosphate reductase activating protein
MNQHEESLVLSQVAFNLAKGVLGTSAPGMGVWTAGCSLACPGCTSQHTWRKSDGRSVVIGQLMAWAKAQTKAPARLTVSGGEPTEQAASVLALIQAFKMGFPLAEVVLYTGLRWPVLLAKHNKLANACDVVIAGPYVQNLPATSLAGSSNQTVQLITPRAEALYADWQNWPMHAMQSAALQKKNATGLQHEIFTAGIPPTRAAMDRAAKSVQAASVTWHTHPKTHQTESLS